MSRSLNRAMLIGNVGAEPDVRTTANGVKIAKVSLATSRTWNDRNGQQQEKTEWHRLKFWDKLADIVEKYVSKGDRIFVDGGIEYSESEDDKGNTRYWTDINVRELVMLGGNSDGAKERKPAAAASKSAPSPFEDDDSDLPF